MRGAVGIFGLVCGLIVVLLVGRYGFKTTDVEVDAWVMAFLFSVIASFGLAGHALAVRLWRHNKLASIAVGIIAVMALGLNLSNSLGAIAGRADSAIMRRVEKNRDIRAAEAELKRLTALRDAMPAFRYTDAEAVEKTTQMAAAATATRKTACPESKKPSEYCREKQTAEAAANIAAKEAAEAKTQTDRAKQLEADAKVQRDKLEQLGPLVTVNVQGSAIARLFRLQDSEVEFAATAQQFGIAIVVELIIIACLSAWEVLGHTHVAAIATRDESHSTKLAVAPTIAEIAAPKDVIEPVAPPPSAPIALPRPKPRLVSDQPPAGDVNEYVVARLEGAQKYQLEFGETYRDYEAWCTAQTLRPLTVEQFAEALKRVCAAAGVRVQRRGATAYLLGVRITQPQNMASASA